jgi:hypothetical protein
VKRKRSCSRCSRPFQNSTSTGSSRRPPQCAGSGTSPESAPRSRDRRPRAPRARKRRDSASRPTPRSAPREAACGSTPPIPPG